jgi:SynChlorMet cassette protein ScmC
LAIVPMNACDSRYLYLADGQSWELVADTSAQDWLESLAGLMQLSRSAPRSAVRLLLTFEQPQSGPDPWWTLPRGLWNLRPELPRIGWRLLNVDRVRLLSHSETDDTVCVLTDPARRGVEKPSMWAGLVPIYLRAQEAGGLLVHSCLLDRDGVGVLLIAPSGTGKSTCARRVGLPWRSLCDDQVLVVKTERNHYHAHPLPTWSALWGSGRHRVWPVHEHVPIRGLFFLRRNQVTRVEPVGRGLAVGLMHESTRSMMAPANTSTKDSEERRSLMRRLFENTCQFVQSVPCYILHANLTTRFWESIEQALGSSLDGTGIVPVHGGDRHDAGPPAAEPVPLVCLDR